MKKAPMKFDISIEVDGTIYEATYTVSSKVVTVQSTYGVGSTQVGGLSAEAVARLLLRDIIAGAASRGALSD